MILQYHCRATAVIRNNITKIILQCHCRATAKTTEIPLKECSAYGQIDQGGSEREETCIYERPQ